MLKAKDIKEMAPAELDKKISEKHQELLQLRFKAVTKQLKNHRQIPQTKKDIARLKTAKRQHEKAWRSLNGSRNK